MKMPVEIKYTIEVDVTDEEYLEMKKNKKIARGYDSSTNV